MDQKYDFSDISVLILEDNLFMRQLVRKMMHGFGVRDLLEGADGSEGLEMMSREHIDIVLCDWLMDPLDGCDFVRTVRTAADSPNPHIPIIMITGHTEPWRVKFARDAGVTEVLAKPISTQTLMHRMVHCIENPRRSIESLTFTGPDRRRRRTDDYKGSERRKSEASQADAMAAAGGSANEEAEESTLSNDDVEALFAQMNN
ncbi:MAG: response regulator [Pseudomonadota bacterium]